ncbi:uncharacterized protein LOC123537819 [Mercenaria mercenaria]|uniref:uncharacterized protein LOC123537819 n=1 Tax=Mercenaria mercenaria TaxID=6596 RepID=UPI00234FAA3D|nr:uncharacterized protein LOC123537819 [Mercenaria mercenaria]
MLSLNVDEATNNNNDKILNVIAQYYDEESEKIEITHLGSRKQNLATAADILDSLESILTEYELNWFQILSVLMDNCSTMRGVRGGVETLVREKNPNLLNVSGDTVHMVNNVSKALMKSVDQSVTAFASDLFYDIEESPKVQEVFAEIQLLMNVTTPKHLIRPISSRFLQMIEVTSRLVECIDVLLVYYFGFLSEEEKTGYRDIISQIFKNHQVSDEAQAAIILLQLSQAKQQKSTTSSERKDRILDHLFHNRRETITKLNLCRGLLCEFQGFVKVFQSESPLIHTLHSRMVDVTTQFVAMFIKPEHIPDKVTALVNLDVTDRNLHKSDKELGVGKYALADINKARIDKKCKHWVSQLYSDLHHGYMMAAQKMLKTLPLNNKMFMSLSVLDPAMASHSQASMALKNIAKQLPNLFTEEEMGELSAEVIKYTVDSDVMDFADEYSKEQRIDTGYWVKVFKLESFNEPRYPVLKKLVSSVLTIFSGPLIESTFNIMDDIVEKDRTKLTVKNYEAVAIVKSSLKRKNVKSTTMKVSRHMKKSCISAYSKYQKYLKEKKENEQAKRAEKLSTSIQQLRMEKAKRVSKLVKLKNRIVNRKRNHDVSQSSSKKGPWKRIKLM